MVSTTKIKNGGISIQELLSFNDLISVVKEELYRVKYKESRINFYVSI